jgi:hypothetical protein
MKLSQYQINKMAEAIFSANVFCGHSGIDYNTARKIARIAADGLEKIRQKNALGFDIPQTADDLNLPPEILASLDSQGDQS